MPVDYEVDPREIEQESFRRIRELIELDAFDRVQQQVVMRVVHSLGQPEIVSALRFSARACEQGMTARYKITVRFCVMSKWCAKLSRDA